MGEKKSKMIKRLEGCLKNPDLKKHIPILRKKVAQLQKKQAELKFKQSVVERVKKANLSEGQRELLINKVKGLMEKGAQGLSLRNPFAQPPTQTDQMQNLLTQWAAQQHVDTPEELYPQTVQRTVRSHTEYLQGLAPVVRNQYLQRIASDVEANKPIVRQYTSIRRDDPELAKRFQSFQRDAIENQGMQPAEVLEAWQGGQQYAEKYNLLREKDPGLANEFRTFLTRARDKGLDRNTAWQQWKGVEDSRIQERQQYRDTIAQLDETDPSGAWSQQFKQFMGQAAREGKSRDEAFQGWEQVQQDRETADMFRGGRTPQRQDTVSPRTRFLGLGDEDQGLSSHLQEDVEHVNPLRITNRGETQDAGDQAVLPGTPQTTRQREIADAHQRMQQLIAERDATQFTQPFADMQGGFDAYRAPRTPEGMGIDPFQTPDPATPTQTLLEAGQELIPERQQPPVYDPSTANIRLGNTSRRRMGEPALPGDIPHGGDEPLEWDPEQPQRRRQLSPDERTGLSWYNWLPGTGLLGWREQQFREIGKAPLQSRVQLPPRDHTPPELRPEFDLDRVFPRETSQQRPQRPAPATEPSFLSQVGDNLIAPLRAGQDLLTRGVDALTQDRADSAVGAQPFSESPMYRRHISGP